MSGSFGESVAFEVVCGSASPVYGSGLSWSSLCNWVAVDDSNVCGPVMSSPDSSIFVEVVDWKIAPDTVPSVEWTAEVASHLVGELDALDSLAGSPGVSIGGGVVSAVVVESIGRTAVAALCGGCFDSVGLCP